MGVIGDAGQQRIYVVLFGDANTDAAGRLRNAYPSHYGLSDQNFLVRTSDLAETVAQTVGIKGSDRIVSGVVFKLNSIYSGYTSRTLWDWLSESEAE